MRFVKEIPNAFVYAMAEYGRLNYKLTLAYIYRLAEATINDDNLQDTGNGICKAKDREFNLNQEYIQKQNLSSL